MIQTEKGTVSVIIPIYNVEKYLDQCMVSIVHQTYSQLEIIMVEDGSPDRCPELCDEWKRRDSRVQVIHKANGGLSDARNAGLRLAKGKYIIFVDPDDWISLHMVERMVNAIELYKADMAVCQYIKVYPDGNMQKSYQGDVSFKVVDRTEMLKLLAENCEITNHVWRKIYRRELVPEDVFPRGKNFEDIVAMPFLLEKCNRIVCLDDAYYFYRYNENGIVRSLNLQNLQNHYEAVLKAYAKIKEIDSSIEDTLEEAKLKAEIGIWRDMLFSRQIKSDEYKILKRNIRNDLKKCSVRKVPGKRRKAFLLLIKYFPFVDKVSLKKYARVFRKLIWLYGFPSKIKAVRAAFKREEKKFIVFCTPSHGNLGDRALMEGERRFAEKYFTEYIFCAVPLEDAWALKFCRRYIRKSDILALHAGGNIGTLYPGIHNKQEKTIKSLKSRMVIIFPQTFYYSDDDAGNTLWKSTRRLYGACRNLQVFVRDKASFRFVCEKMSHIKVELMPDMALMLPEHGNSGKIRQGALICFRNDAEKTMPVEGWDKILEFFEDRYTYLEQIDTHVYHGLSEDMARKEIKQLISKIASAEIMVTDRLHGMIFALIAKTPCVVIASKSHKIEGVYEWIKENGYIQLIKDPGDVPIAAARALGADNTVIHREALDQRFEQMAQIIRNRHREYSLGSFLLRRQGEI